MIHQVLEPTAAEKDWAARVLKAFEESGRAAFKLDGQMVDMPVIEKARRILQSHP